MWSSQQFLSCFRISFTGTTFAPLIEAILSNSRNSFRKTIFLTEKIHIFLKGIWYLIPFEHMDRAKSHKNQTSPAPIKIGPPKTAF